MTGGGDGRRERQRQSAASWGTHGTAGQPEMPYGRMRWEAAGGGCQSAGPLATRERDWCECKWGGDWAVLEGEGGYADHQSHPHRDYCKSIPTLLNFRLVTGESFDLGFGVHHSWCRM